MSRSEELLKSINNDLARLTDRILDSKNLVKSLQFKYDELASVYKSKEIHWLRISIEFDDIIQFLNCHEALINEWIIEKFESTNSESNQFLKSVESQYDTTKLGIFVWIRVYLPGNNAVTKERIAFEYFERLPMQYYYDPKKWVTPKIKLESKEQRGEYVNQVKSELSTKFKLKRFDDAMEDKVSKWIESGGSGFQEEIIFKGGNSKPVTYCILFK